MHVDHLIIWQPQTSTYLALAELGNAIKMIFLCRYLHSEALRREIREGLNVIENWNGANSFILYGEGGEIATNDLPKKCRAFDTKGQTSDSDLAQLFAFWLNSNTVPKLSQDCLQSFILA